MRYRTAKIIALSLLCLAVFGGAGLLTFYGFTGLPEVQDPLAAVMGVVLLAIFSGAMVGILGELGK